MDRDVQESWRESLLIRVVGLVLALDPGLVRILDKSLYRR